MSAWRDMTDPFPTVADKLREELAAKDAEIERLKAKVVEYSEVIDVDHHVELKLRAALRETREALRDVSGLAAKAANCELAAAASLEPDTDVFGSSGIADKALTARSKAAWKELDDRIDAVLARHAPLVGEAPCGDCHGTGTVVSYEVGSGGDVAVEPCGCDLAGEEKANGAG